jgi:hypothetical protein
MTRPYFIAPYEPEKWRESTSDLQIDPEEYLDLLARDWPDIEFYNPQAPVLLSWSIPDPGGGRITGGLQDNRQVVWLDIPHEEFFLWHRTVIPAEHRLYLFAASSTSSLELTETTTYQDIETFVGGPAE